MNFKILLFLQLFKMYHSTDILSEKVIDHFIKDTENSIGSKHITLIVDSLSKDFSVPSFFMRRIVNKFPSFIVNVAGYSNKTLIIPPSQELQTSLSKASEGENLNVILVTNTDIKSTLEKLMEYLQLIISFRPSFKRPKAIVFLFNLSDRINIGTFLKKCWNIQILDITVVELIQERTFNKFFHSINTSSVVVHHYNLFNNHYKKDLFSAQVAIFSDKLKKFTRICIDGRFSSSLYGKRT